MPDYLGRFGEYDNIEFWDADPDGSLDKLIGRDPWEARREIEARILALDLAVGPNSSIAEVDREEIMGSVLGTEMEFVDGRGNRHKGIVVGITETDHIGALVDLAQPYTEDPSKGRLVTIEFPDLFERNDLPN